MSTKNFVSYGDAETLFTGIGNKLSTLKSGLTNLDNEVNGDATVYPYADVITIEDAVHANLADCTVKIEPVQDLHGYDKPWVGGAGKNKADTESAEKFATGASTDVITLTKSQTSLRIQTVGASYSGAFIDVTLPEAGTYTLNCSWVFNTSGYGCIQAFDSNDTKIFDSSNFSTDGQLGGRQITISENFIRIRFFGTWSNTDGDVTFSNIQLELGSTATSFVPYSNICPITGHTEASVQRDGRNLFNEVYPDISSSVKRVYLYVGNGTFTMSTTTPLAGGPSANLFFVSGEFAGNVSTSTDGVSNGVSRTVTSIDGYVTVAYRNNGNVDPRNYETQIERGSTPTAYTPYVAGKTYTIALGDTIYGGTVDFDSGVMTVDRAIDTLTSLNRTNDHSFYKPPTTQAETGQTTIDKVLCDRLPTGNIEAKDSLFINNSGNVRINTTQAFSTAEEAMAYLGGSYTLTYRIATPFTIQLTPQQIQLLKGTNTITASTGQISVTANGVSGAIGSVQEQVNGLAEDLIVDKSQTTEPVDVDGTFQIGANVLSHNIIIVGMHRYAYGASVVLQKEVLEAGLYANGCGIYVDQNTYVNFTVTNTGLLTIKSRATGWGAVNILTYGIL